MVHVLIVDDSITLQKMLSEFLKAHGLRVSVAGDGKTALEFLENELPDLVVVDVVMPGMNGYELCRKIKENPKTKALPVVMCTSKNEQVDRYWGLKQGADAYIAKPFKPSELVQTLKRLLQP